MTEATEDATLSVCNDMALEIKEVRSSSTMHSPKDGFEEISSETRTRFHWKLRGMASKVGLAVVESASFDPQDQELYDIAIASHGFNEGYAFSGFKSREGAIRNALGFAEQNGIKVDGYKAKAERSS